MAITTISSIIVIPRFRFIRRPSCHTNAHQPTVAKDAVQREIWQAFKERLGSTAEGLAPSRPPPTGFIPVGANVECERPDRPPHSTYFTTGTSPAGSPASRNRWMRTARRTDYDYFSSRLPFASPFSFIAPVHLNSFIE
jgi:hypothetical protein